MTPTEGYRLAAITRRRGEARKAHAAARQMGPAPFTRGRAAELVDAFSGGAYKTLTRAQLDLCEYHHGVGDFYTWRLQQKTRLDQGLETDMEILARGGQIAQPGEKL